MDLADFMKDKEEGDSAEEEQSDEELGQILLDAIKSGNAKDVYLAVCSIQAHHEEHGAATVAEEEEEDIE